MLGSVGITEEVDGGRMMSPRSHNWLRGIIGKSDKNIPGVNYYVIE